MKKHKKLNTYNAGFTLVELLVVVAILGVITAIGITSFSGFINKSKINASKANHKQIYNLVAVKALQCTLGEKRIKYTNSNGNAEEINCPVSIDDFVNIMNKHLYSLSIPSPYWGNNPPYSSW